ncbi:MAG TPA: type II toxin-antitoxin system VapC family toxin [Solirubrobacterales bacterium]|nr:type II toxin-antitoxin system VapC family toxin [Solirubrobacterales bacterium]
MLYLDASGLVKRYIKEDGSDLVVEAMDGARVLSTCRICFVEAVRAIAVGGNGRDVKKMESEWALLDVIEVDQALTERAAKLAVSRRLRSLDALHLAAALSLPDDGDLTLATWDVRLHRAAQDEGLATLPVKL